MAVALACLPACLTILTALSRETAPIALAPARNPSSMPPDHAGLGPSRTAQGHEQAAQGLRRRLPPLGVALAGVKHLPPSGVALARVIPFVVLQQRQLAAVLVLLPAVRAQQHKLSTTGMQCMNIPSLRRRPVGPAGTRQAGSRTADPLPLMLLLPATPVPCFPPSGLQPFNNKKRTF